MSSEVRSLRSRCAGRPSTVGLIVGGVAALASLVPSLLPRSWAAQAAITAICFAIGYGVGVLAVVLFRSIRRLLVDRTTREHDSRAVRSHVLPRSLRVVIGIVVGVVTVIALVCWQGWQDEQRDLVGLAHLSRWWIPAMVLLAALLAVLLVLVGRVVGFVVGSADRCLARAIPAWSAHLVVVVALVGLGWFVVDDGIRGALIDVVGRVYSDSDDRATPGVERPNHPEVSGSPESFVRWDTLGNDGRRFVAGASSRASLERTAGAGVVVEPPIRVYVGLRSAATLDDRVGLALRELERTGAFDRDVLAVVTSTGTGLVDPAAASALEHVHGGATAMVSMQYSTLPSWLSFLADRESSVEASEALNDAVHDRWSELPAGSRPKLVVFGESLGSYGSDSAFARSDAESSVATLRDRTDGVLWVGPTNANPIWQQVVDGRQHGTPSWLPVFDDGRTVRFAPRPSRLTPDGTWEGTRVLIVQHPSDPVGWWNMETLWRPQPWTVHPTGYDVPSAVRWFPVVTWVQAVADLIAGSSTPPGHGHDYGNSLVSAWATVVPPDGWTEADTVRVERALRR